MIPDFANTEEALAFGKIASPKQRIKLHKLRQRLLGQSNRAISQGNHQKALDAACAAQLYREALASGDSLLTFSEKHIRQK